MYIAQSCTEPNSETPMTQQRIAVQIYRMAPIETRMSDGNADMSALVNGLTPPVPTGQCSDFLSSAVLAPMYPFPVRAAAGAVPGVAATGAVTPVSAAAAAPASVSPSVASTPGSPTPAGSSASTNPPSGPGWARGSLANGPRAGRGHGAGFFGTYPYGSIIQTMRKQVSNFTCPLIATPGSPGTPPGGPASNSTSGMVLVGAILIGVILMALPQGGRE